MIVKLKCRFFSLLIWFGLMSGEVHGRVFKEQETSPSATASIDAGLQGGQQGYRKYLLNGVRVDGRIAYTDYRPAELVSILNADWSAKAAKVFVNNELSNPGASMAKPLVSVGDGWAMFANLNLLGRSPKTAGIPALEDKYIVFSAESHSNGMSEVWVIKIPQATDPLSLFSPHKHPKQLPVFPGSQLGWSVVEAVGALESELYIYSSSGNVGEHSTHYKKVFSDEGFLFDEESQLETGVRLLFSRRGVELDIFIQREQSGAQQIATIIQLRKRV